MSDVQVQNLDSILKDPMNADFSNIEGLMSEATQEAAASTEGDEDVKTTGDTSDASATGNEDQKDASAKTVSDDEIQPGAVIKTRDGKHEIPFDVLQRERDRNKELQARLAELSAKAANTEQAAQTGSVDTTRSIEEIIPADELAQLKEDAPNLASVFEKLIHRIGELEASATKVERREQDDVARRVQEAIDSIPKLVYLQSADPEKFDAVAAIDQWAKDQPQFKDLSLAERFDKCLSMYEAAHGVVQLPASASGKKTTATDANAKAEAAIAKAMQSAAPNTLTDIPGGNPPAANDIEAVAGMSAVMLTQHLMGMDQAGMEKFLSKFA